MEDPRRHGREPPRQRSERLAILRRHRRRRPRAEPHRDEPAHRRDRREALRVPIREVPRAVAAHRQARQVDPVRVRPELRLRTLQRGHRRLRHPARPCRITRRLREHDDRRKPRRVSPQRSAKAYRRLDQPVAAALARAVQE